MKEADSLAASLGIGENNIMITICSGVPSHGRRGSARGEVRELAKMLISASDCIRVLSLMKTLIILDNQEIRRGASFLARKIISRCPCRPFQEKRGCSMQ